MLLLLLTGCAFTQPTVLRLATTTSTYDSGLLDAILPVFEAEFGVDVDVVAVGTGQAIAIGEAGDVDVILVHARSREDAFVQGGYGTERFDVMYNDFVLVGPSEDPAGVQGLLTAAEALRIVEKKKVNFASRGDDSGTHTRELHLWGMAGVVPDTMASWYFALGQGMGATLQFAEESRAYTLTDRGTYLALRDRLSNLEVMVGGDSIEENADPDLRNPYGIIPVNPDRHPGVAYDGALQFVRWITSLDVQQMIAAYGLDLYGQPLFYPNSQMWHDAGG